MSYGELEHVLSARPKREGGGGAQFEVDEALSINVDGVFGIFKLLLRAFLSVRVF